MPTAMRVEIQSIVTPGVWTDVTAYVDWSAGAATRYGRTSPYSAPQPANLTLTLVNDDGRFTPLRQVLADGVTPHPYWPNLIPRRRIRLSWIIGATPYYRFNGLIKGFPPGMRDGFTPRVAITALDDRDRLSRVQMTAGISGEIIKGVPIAYWPLSEPVASVSAADASGRNAVPLNLSGAGAAAVFGVGGPGTEQGSAVRFAAGQGLRTPTSPRLTLAGLSVVCWVRFTSTPAPLESIVSLVDSSGGFREIVTGNAGPAGVGPAYGFQFVEVQPQVGYPAGGSPGGSIALNPFTDPANDGLWHQVVVTMVDGLSTPILYVDGHSNGGFAGSYPFGQIAGVAVGVGWAAPFTGDVADVAIYDRVLSPTEISQQYLMAQQTGETVSDKVKRFLTYGGLTAANWNIDTSTVLTSTYGQDGKDVAAACDDMATTEGGGAAFYFTPDGLARFLNRSYRKPGAPSLTIDVGADLDGSTYQPAYDDASLANRITGNRVTGSGTASTQVALDQPAITASGVYDDQFSSSAASDLDVLTNAQDRLAAQKTPQFRVQQLAVDLATATTAGLYAAVAATLLGNRIRVTNLYAAAAPASQVDVLVEGWADTYSPDEVTVTFDTSPADSPARAVWGDAAFGRWQPTADCVLNSAVSNSATTVIIATPTAPQFTTTGGDYPLIISVGAEQIRLNGAPSGGTSPQTWTGCTRGVNGTTPAAQAAGAQVQLWPASAWTL